MEILLLHNKILMYVIIHQDFHLNIMLELLALEPWLKGKNDFKNTHKILTRDVVKFFVFPK